MKYNITEEDEDIVEDFIERSMSNHIRSTRSEAQVKEDIRVGKLGEIAYKHYCGDDISEIDWEDRVQGDGLDFKRKDGTGIQVKTLNSDTKWCTFYDWKWDILVVFRLVGDTIELIGEFDRSYVKGIARESNWKGWYIDPEKCV